MNSHGASSVIQLSPGALVRRDAAVGTGLWLFIVVASALFSLFIAAYLMRMEGSDWSTIGLPWQLWVSTTLLAAGSVALQLAAIAARLLQHRRARVLFLAGGACALGFLVVQVLAWQALLGMQVKLVGNPAGSFFYLLTALHGAHVLGGLVGWGAAGREVWHGGDASHIARFITLCARYWHFLLAVWVVLFATLGGVTPEVVRFLCGVP